MAVVILLLLSTLPLLAQGPASGNAFQEATRALEEGRNADYLTLMRRAMELEPDKLSRPYFQYNLARAQALNGLVDDSVATLRALMEERLEGPMVVLSEHDPAFENVRGSAAYRSLLASVDNVRIEVTPARGNVFEVGGAGCNLAVSVGEDGLLFVDSGYRRTSQAVLEAIAQKTKSRARGRFVINTHGHYDHAASNSALAPDGVVIAHREARLLMKSGDDFVHGYRIPPVDAASVADLTVEDEMTVHFNGEAVRIIALPSHTSGDVVVFFTGSKVLHMGDNFFSDVGTRLRPGKNVAEYFDRIAPLVAALGNDGVVLFGHGRRLSGSELRAVYDRSIQVYHFVRERISAKSSAEIQSEAKSTNLPADWVEYYVKRLSER